MTRHSARTITKCLEAPQSLNSSELNASFNDREISVPSTWKTMNPVFNVGDLEQLLFSMRFRTKKDFPDEAIDFLFKSWSHDINLLLQRHLQDHPTLLSLLTSLQNCKPGSEYNEACTYGRLDFLLYFERQDKPIGLDALKAAANGGHLDCVMHVHRILENDKDRDWRKIDVREAAAAGHLSCLQYLIEAGLIVKIPLCASAAQHDQLTVLKYLIAQRRSMFTYITLRTMWQAAIQGESLLCMEYLLETFSTQLPIAELVEEACKAKKGSVLKLLLLRDCVSLQSVVNAAVRAGSIECLVYLHYDCNANCLVHSTMMAAAKADQLFLVFKLLESDCTFDNDALTKWLTAEEKSLQPLPLIFQQPMRGKVLQLIRKYLELLQQLNDFQSSCHMDRVSSRI